MLLYITADKIGEASGGGSVTHHESEALKSLGQCIVYGREQLSGCTGEEPWKWDDCVGGEVYRQWLGHSAGVVVDKPKLAHLYAGTFGRTVGQLKKFGSQVSYTIAAHDRFESWKEHEYLGMPFPYEHLKQDALWQRYTSGYAQADVIVSPSKVSEATIRRYGGVFETKKIVVIPHGCNLPKKVEPYPDRFVVGYLGSYGADKGVIYLIQAWKKLNYKDAVLKLGGRDSSSPWLMQAVKQFGGGNVQLCGWQNDVSDFYNSLSMYVQPSVTEGFGCEILEAFAHHRPALCSLGAGASDRVPPDWTFPARDVDRLAEMIDAVRKDGDLAGPGAIARVTAELFTWDKIRERYVKLWREMLA